MSWAYTEYNLDELGELGRGKSKHRPRNDPALFGGEYPFIQTGDVRAANLHLTGFSDTYSELGLAQSKLWKKGTLLITIAANIAETAILKFDSCFPDSIVGFVPNESKVNAYFIKYYIDFIKLEIQQISQGTTQDNLSLEKLRTFKLKVPEKCIVDEITQQLLSYDNLIENNNRRIAILEDIAQSLYREWFVKFRFPGHENCKLKDSPLGQIPEVWEVKKLKDLTSKIGSGATPRGGKGAYKSEGIPLIRSMNIYDSKFITKNLAFIDDDQAFKLKNAIVEPQDVLLNITGASVARCAIVPSACTPARVNQHVAIIRVTDSDICPEYVLYTLISHVGKTRLLNIAQGGATREAITKGHIENLEILIPPAAINKQFSHLAKSISRKKEVLFLKNENLKAQRDMLLPRLISGSIDV
ncbi:MAG: restriction endonuclease subunit S [Cycloclasticus sp.]